MVNRRQPFVAGQFYPARESDCRRELEQYTQYNSESAEPAGAPCAGIVPHAGWVFSGPTAGKVFRFIKDRITPETFILLGAAHRAFSRQPVLYPDGAWDTPLGPVAVDEQIAAALANASETPVLRDPALHDGEHSIEVQAPFIKYLFPDARIVPVLMPSGDTAVPFGNAVGRVLEQNPGRVAVVASTDLTHYGHQYGFAPKGEGEEAHRWAKQVNDQRFIAAALALDGNKIIEDAAHYHTACGAGAAAAAVTGAHYVSAQGGLLEHVTSHEVIPRGRPGMFVGYAGLVFCCAQHK